MSTLELWGLFSNVVTVLGLPLAIFTFIHEQRKERDNEDEEVYQLLSDAYGDFMKLVLANPDLKLRTQTATPNLTEEQEERMRVLFDILIALFERAYLAAYDRRRVLQEICWEQRRSRQATAIVLARPPSGRPPILPLRQNCLRCRSYRGMPHPATTIQ